MHTSSMKFYIVTPTYNSLHWLPRCIRSVADQVGRDVEVHHHVQDGASSDGTVEWLAQWKQNHMDVPGYQFTYESAVDAGMYDAINKAWQKLPDSADMTAHLNSDEQYLPDTLQRIAHWVTKKPNADVLLGTYIITDSDNDYICHRRPVMPHAWFCRLNCVCITNSSFYKAELFQRLHPRFEPRWKCQGDLVFFRELIWNHVRFEIIPEVTSLFVCTGENLAWTDKARTEWLEICAEQPAFWSKINGLVYRWVNLKRRFADLIYPSPESYSAYCSDSNSRKTYKIKHPTVRWVHGARRLKNEKAKNKR